MENEVSRTPYDPLERPAAWRIALETAIATVLVPLLGQWLRPHDPFFMDTTFPWSALAPLLLGLRHGAAAGLASSSALVLAITLWWRGGHSDLAAFPGQFALALLALALVGGEFSDMWTRRQQRMGAMLDYHRLRLEEFTRTYQVLKASHDILQQRLAADDQSLRDALISLRRQLAEGVAARPGDPLRGASDTILHLFADFGHVQVAEVFPVDVRGVLGPSAGRLGEAPPTPVDDPLLRRALLAGKLATVAVELRGREATTTLLAAVPLIDVNERIWGVVAIREMPFVSFASHSLKLLAVLGGHIGDMLAFGREQPPAADFSREVRRCLTDAKRYRVPSSILRIGGRKEERVRVLFDKISSQRRGLDRALVVENGGPDRWLFLLLPLTDEAGFEGFKERIEGLARAQFGSSLRDAGFSVDGGMLHAERNVSDLLAPLAAHELSA